MSERCRVKRNLFMRNLRSIFVKNLFPIKPKFGILVFPTSDRILFNKGVPIKTEKGSTQKLGARYGTVGCAAGLRARGHTCGLRNSSGRGFLAPQKVLLITAVNKIGFCDPYRGTTGLV